MRTLYFDCFAGAAGNMILAALIELGADPDELRRRIGLLGLDGVELEISRVDRSGISSTHVDVKFPHEHVHRHLSDIRRIIEGSGLSVSVKQRSLEIFTRLAEAEARVHGIEVNKVHFHEVGAVDAIVDIVGCCIAIELLGVERFASSRIHVGSGFVDMAHGRFPVPPPAVAELLRGKPIYSTEVAGELVTPTGAAIIAVLCDSYGPLPDLVVESIGYGAGTRDYEGTPNVLRLLLGQTEGSSSRVERESLYLIECNIDDLSPQVLSYAMESAFRLGALDCWFTPIQMKKSRPATQLSILCRRERSDELKQMLYRETTTLGVRTHVVERECLSREFHSVETRFGKITIKVASMGGETVNVLPEFDDLRAAAMQHGVPLTEVREAALTAFSEKNGAQADAAAAN